jgi:hypothetical protein
MSRISLVTSTAIAALTLLSSTALAQQKTINAKHLTNKHPVHAIVERNTESGWGIGTCTGNTMCDSLTG